MGLKLKDYFICYIDILGYKDIIKYTDEQNFLEKINEAYRKTYEHSRKNLHIRKQNGETKILRNHIKVFSDNIIIAIPKTKDIDIDIDIFQYTILLIGFLQLEFIKMGILIRGSITSGTLYINSNYVFGSGLIQAYRLENEISIFPRIIIDRKLITFISNMKNILKKDIDGYTFIHYLILTKIPNGNADEDIEIINTFNKLVISKPLPFEHLQIHKSLIENGISLYSAKERVLQKYLWCREYHNEFCNIKNFKEYIIK